MPWVRVNLASGGGGGGGGFVFFFWLLSGSWFFLFLFRLSCVLRSVVCPEPLPGWSGAPVQWFARCFRSREEYIRESLARSKSSWSWYSPSDSSPSERNEASSPSLSKNSSA